MYRVDTGVATVTEDRLVLRIDSELKKAVQDKAKAEDLTVSQVIRRLLREWLADDPPQDEQGRKKSQE